MSRVLTAMTILLLADASVIPAIAGQRGPVCREASVVDEMAREIRNKDYYTAVDMALVTERPTVVLNVVRCDVCVLTAPYDTRRFGEQPIGHCVMRGFEVRIVPAGFVIRDLG